MAINILRLSDGPETIDFHVSPLQVLAGGVEMPPPTLQRSFVSSSFVDGDRLANARYSNRIITIRFVITESSIANLQTQIRTIERLLNDARERTLLGYGNQVYLEYQWGTTAGQSVYFDVNSGELILPLGFSSAVMWKSNLIINARVVLNCEPFGRFAPQTIASATLENSQSTQDISISYLVDDDVQIAMADVNDWCAQTFTTVGAITTTKGAFKVWRTASGTPGTATIAIYEMDNGDPDVPAGLLATGTIDVSNIAEADHEPDWIVVTFGTPVLLSAGTKYALIIHADGVAGADGLYVRYDQNDGDYAGGNRLFSDDAGATWTPSANDDHVFAIYVAETGQENWQDITTDATYGDRPAKLYLKLTQAAATDTKKVWIAKRSGARFDDDLWIEGEAYSSFIDEVGGIHHTGEYESLISGGSGEEMVRVRCEPQGDNIAADTLVARLNYTISTLPRGQFRVLARCQSTPKDAADIAHISFGVGWSYGDRAYTPTEAAGDYYQCAASGIPEILDLGILNIPPIAESDMAANSNLELQIYLYASELLAQNEYYKWDIDFLFFLPVDEGVVIVDDVKAADVIAIDSITDPKGVFILDGADKVVNIPNRVGKPFDLGREDTRIYILRDDVKGVVFTVDMTYQPQFLIV